jgi:hypothetical protein
MKELTKVLQFCVLVTSGLVTSLLLWDVTQRKVVVTTPRNFQEERSPCLDRVGNLKSRTSGF